MPRTTSKTPLSAEPFLAAAEDIAQESKTDACVGVILAPSFPDFNVILTNKTGQNFVEFLPFMVWIYRIPEIRGVSILVRNFEAHSLPARFAGSVLYNFFPYL